VAQKRESLGWLLKDEGKTKFEVTMFFYADTAAAPWSIIKQNAKNGVWLNCLQHFLNTLPYAKNESQGS
jgi:polyphosphate kinase 2 (PPK2 family)